MCLHERSGYVETIVHAAELPAHGNLITIKPVAQASPSELAKGPLRVTDA